MSYKSYGRYGDEGQRVVSEAIGAFSAAGLFGMLSMRLAYHHLDLMQNRKSYDYLRGYSNDC